MNMLAASVVTGTSTILGGTFVAGEGKILSGVLELSAPDGGHMWLFLKKDRYCVPCILFNMDYFNDSGVWCDVSSF